MDKVELAKLVIRMVSTAGVGEVVKNVVTATTPVDIKIGSRILVGIGQFIVSAMVMEASDQFVENRLNAIQMAVMMYIESRKSVK